MTTHHFYTHGRCNRVLGREVKILLIKAARTFWNLMGIRLKVTSWIPSRHSLHIQCKCIDLFSFCTWRQWTFIKTGYCIRLKPVFTHNHTQYVRCLLNASHFTVFYPDLSFVKTVTSLFMKHFLRYCIENWWISIKKISRKLKLSSNYR